MANISTSYVLCGIEANPRDLKTVADPAGVVPLSLSIEMDFYFNVEADGWILAVLGLFLCQHKATNCSQNSSSWFP